MRNNITHCVGKKFFRPEMSIFIFLF